jgi:hypothetical protein
MAETRLSTPSSRDNAFGLTGDGRALNQNYFSNDD